MDQNHHPGHGGTRYWPSSPPEKKVKHQCALSSMLLVGRRTLSGLHYPLFWPHKWLWFQKNYPSLPDQFKGWWKCESSGLFCGTRSTSNTWNTCNSRPKLKTATATLFYDSMSLTSSRTWVKVVSIQTKGRWHRDSNSWSDSWAGKPCSYHQSTSYNIPLNSDILFSQHIMNHFLFLNKRNSFTGLENLLAFSIPVLLGLFKDFWRFPGLQQY